jgi:hypothetical protein
MTAYLHQNTYGYGGTNVTYELRDCRLLFIDDESGKEFIQN